MSIRQLADRDGHRWDVEDEGPVDDRAGTRGRAQHQLRFRRDDGTELTRTAHGGLDELADLELRALLEDQDVESVERGVDRG